MLSVRSQGADEIPLSARLTADEQIQIAGLNERLVSHPALGHAGSARLQSGPAVAVVGVGNLGSRLATNLATLGVPLLLVDDGLVESVNVGLQLYSIDEIGAAKVEAARRRLHRTRPDLPIECYRQDVRRLGARLLSQCRLWISCVDTLSVRVWLNELSAHLAVPCLDLALDGSGLSLYGRVSGFDPGHGTACLACGWDDENWAEVAGEQRGAGCAALRAEADADRPATLALPGLGDVIAGLGTIQSVRLLLDSERDRVLGREWRMNLSAGRLDEISLAPSPRCRLSHQVWHTSLLEFTPASLTVDHLFALAARQLPGEVRLSVYGDRLVLEAGCVDCHKPTPVACLAEAVPDCPSCGGRLVPLVEKTRSQFRRADVEQCLGLTWQAIGLVTGGAVCAANDAGEEVVYLFGL